MCLGALVLVLACSANGQTQTRNGSVLGWNNLGMHCADGDFSVFSLLPPYNTVHSQVIDANGKLITNQSGVSVTYMAVADPNGSINKTSVGKTNFWDYVNPLFGVTLQPDVGLPVPGPESFSMPGAANTPQAMKYEATYDWMAAYGVPITATDDAGNINTYPVMRLTGKSGSTVIATRDVVLPVSTEINCMACHASGSSPNAQPSGGWVNVADAERDFRLNVLLLHDDRQLGTPAFTAALAAAKFDPNGLYATVTSSGKAILCASCHLSEALPGTGQGNIPPLTSSMHTLHSKVLDPANGLTLDSTDNRTSCYYCHPGKETKCLRGVMGRSVAPSGDLAIQCQSCHGQMSQVGSVNRTGWLDEPSCQACHTGDAVTNSGQIRYQTVFSSGNTMRTPVNQRFATVPNTPATGFSLYRFSKGHGGLNCEACHNSTHAEFPSIDDTDNIMSIQQQGYIGPIAECQSCHGISPNTVSGGPHGLHPLGQTWVSRHPDNAGASCRTCHGTDYRGTVLSRSRTDRTLNAFGSKVFWRGFQIGCYSCHNGPNNDSANSNTPAVVKNLTATTPAGKAVAISLQASDANNNPLTLRIVSQPANGTAGLSGTDITYFPDSGFSGTDSMTYAAWDGSTDSNLGTIDITVTGGGASYTITPANATFGAAAGTGTVTVGTTAGSKWTAVSNDPWITITAGASGTGTGNVAYSVSANTGTAVRSGTMTIAGQSFIVNQAAQGVVCTYTIAPAGASINSSAYSGNVTVTTTPGCAWTATSSAPWITITAGTSGTGSGTVAFNVAANTGVARSGNMTIAGKTFTVSQAAPPAPSAYTIAPMVIYYNYTAHKGKVAVMTAADKAWTATSSVPWIVITAGAKGTGPGNVAYSVVANPDDVGRTGTLAIADKTFTVFQADKGSAYRITPSRVSLPAAASKGTITVTTGEGCSWMVSNNVPWVTITSGESGTGTGTVAYTVDENTADVARRATITVAGKTFLIIQARAKCEYTINPVNTNVTSLGGDGSVTVTTSSQACRWTALSHVAWVKILTGFTGTGNGVVTYRIAANTTTRSRTGTVTIAGNVFTVTQSSGDNQGNKGKLGSEFGTVVLDTRSNRQLLTAELIMQNDGKSEVTGVQPAVYLSNDGVRDASDTLLWSRPVEGLQPGESVVNKFRITLPGGVVGKGKYLVAMNGDSDKNPVVYGPIE